MRYEVTTEGGLTRKDLRLEEFASIINVREHTMFSQMDLHSTYTRKVHLDSKTPTIIVTRTR